MNPQELNNRASDVNQPRPRGRMTFDGVPTLRPDYAARPTPAPQLASPVSTASEQPIPAMEQPAPLLQPELLEQSTEPIIIDERSQTPLVNPNSEDDLESDSDPSPATTTPAPKLFDFKPPEKVKKRRQIIPSFRKPTLRVSRTIQIFVGAGVLVMAILGAVYGMSQHGSSADSDLRQALTAALSTTQLHTDISGTQRTSLDFDFSKPMDPIVSSSSMLQLSGSPVKLAAYGTNRDTYISYTSLPATAPAALAKTITGNWVQLRAANKPAVGVPSDLARAADPRYQVYGPLLFGSLNEANRKQLVDYALGHTVYDYTGTKPVEDKLRDTKVIKYAVKPNISELKIINQSMANFNGLSPADIQEAVDGIERMKGSEMQLFINKKSHHIMQLQITKKNQTTTYDYTDKATVAAEPQTKLTWQMFASTQFQIAGQLAAKQPAAAIDGMRKQKIDTIHQYIKAYFLQTNSYPSLSNINDQTWIVANLPGLDADTVRDPIGTSQAVLATPKPNTFGYLVTADGGKATCNNTAENPCTHFKLAAVLSNGQQHIVQDP